MSRHIIDKRHESGNARLLFRYASLLREAKPHRASKTLQRRTKQRGSGLARRLAYLRIEAGRIA